VAVLSRCADLSFADVFSAPVSKGIIWFLVAVATGALPTVRLANPGFVATFLTCHQFSIADLPPFGPKR
jgi:hypothetical protein